MTGASPRSAARALAAFVLGLSLFAATGPTAVSATQGSDEVSVRVVDFAFEPGALTVALGTTLTWTNAGARPHTVSAVDGSFDSGRLDPGEQFRHTFDQVGAFDYFCGFHPGMRASVIVIQTPLDGIEVATTGRTTAESGALAADEGPSAPALNLAPAAPSRLAHVHAGSCQELGIVVYSFPDIRTYRIAPNEENGVGSVELIVGTTQAALGDLFGEPFSIHVHESAENKQRYLACSDVGGRPGDPWQESEGLVLPAVEQQDSGFSGFSILRPSPAGGTEVAIVLAASSRAVQASAAEPEAPPGAVYTSPTFGYTIGYGPAWQEAENASRNGRDRFVLFNGVSYLTFTGTREFGADPQSCVDAFVAQLTADPNVSNLAPATDEAGNPLQRETAATGIAAIFNHDYTFSDRVEPYTLFVGCIPLPADDAVIAVVQNVPTAAYNDQVAPREALLRGLTLDQ